MRLAGRIALVTGAGRGMGRAIALRLAEEGADVVVNDVEQARADAVARLVTERGRRALAVSCDVSDSAAVRAMFERADAALGAVDILVNNAGIGGRGEVYDLSDELWRRVFGVNTDGVFYCTREASRRMVAKGRGKIINIASSCGQNGCALASAYSASKAAVIGFSKAIALDLAPRGVIVNVISPGYVDTEGLAILPRPVIDAAIARTALKRLADPSEIAAAAAFLASDEADYFVGQVLCPTGGAPV